MLFAGLLCLIGPLLFGHDFGWAPWLWLVMALGVAILVAFIKLERTVAARGGMPLIDLALLSDKAFMRGLGAAFFFFFANLSFYLVMTMFMQKALQFRRCRRDWYFCRSRSLLSSPRATAVSGQSIAARWC